MFRSKKRSRRRAYEEAALAIEAFVDGRTGPWDWDDFISIKEEDALLESVRLRCCSTRDDYPTKIVGRYCSDEGFEILRSLAKNLREELDSLPNDEGA